MDRPRRDDPAAGAWRAPADAVRLADVATASRLAREAASPFGRALPAAELLARFGGDTPEGRRRAATALELAGVAVDPPLARAAPHELVRLRRLPAAPGPAAAATPPPRRRAGAAVLGALGLALVLVAALVLRGALGGDGESAATWTAPAAGAPAAAPAGGTTAPTTAPAGTTTTPSSADERATTAAPPAADARPGRRGQVAPRPGRRAADGRRRGAAAPAAAAPDAGAGPRRAAPAVGAPAGRRRRRPRTAVLRIVPSEPSYVCVAEEDRTPIFRGMLAEPLTVRRARLRLRIGVGTARITANGRPLVVNVAPSNYRITPRGVEPLPAGLRMCD